MSESSSLPLTCSEEAEAEEAGQKLKDGSRGEKSIVIVFRLREASFTRD